MLLLYALARPIATSLIASSNNSTLFDSVTGECIDINGCRTVAGILWSCLSLIFLCTWVAIHPNIPQVSVSPALVHHQNVSLMVIALLAPEIMFLWAMRQRASAKAIAEGFYEYGWTMAHGFFVIMGGFALYDGDTFCGYLWNTREELDEQYWERIKNRFPEGGDDSREGIVADTTVKMEDTTLPRAETMPRDEESGTRDATRACEPMSVLKYLVANGYITVTEKEIQDRSHGDFISKSIAFLQSAWFILQVIARGVEGLAITELEIIAVGFAILNFGICFLWWHKPLRVQCPVCIVVQPKKPRLKARDRNLSWPEKIAVWLSWPLRKLWSFLNALFEISLGVELQLYGGPLGSPRYSRLYPRLHRLVQIVTSLLRGTIPGPLLCDFDMAAAFMQDKNMLRVPMHISSRLRQDSTPLYIIAYGTAAIFGAIHFIPWNFEFPTHIEQVLWRISTVGVATAPIVIVIMQIASRIRRVARILESIDRELQTRIDGLLREPRTDINVLSTFKYRILLSRLLCSKTIISGVVIQNSLGFLYLVFRGILLALGFCTLRDPPESAYQAVQWTNFIPHIS